MIGKLTGILSDKNPPQVIVDCGGVYALDADLSSNWEAALVGKSALGKALWLLLYPVVHTPGLVATVSHLFDLLWSSSRYPQDSQSPGTLATSGAPDFDDLERTVLRLLASGHKDEAVARRVGLSLRSVRRVIGSISAQLGTSSRFELGVRCHDLGLTSLDPRPDPASLGSRERGAPGLA